MNKTPYPMSKTPNQYSYYSYPGNIVDREFEDDQLLQIAMSLLRLLHKDLIYTRNRVTHLELHIKNLLKEKDQS